MTPFTIDDRQYRARPFDADVHISLMLRLSPLFASMIAAAPSLLAARQRHEEADQPTDTVARLADLSAAAGPVAERLAALDRNGDAKGIIDACLQAADQMVDGKGHPVMTKAGVISNRDNGTYVMKLKITMNVVRINFDGTLKGMGLDIDALMGGSPDADV